MPCNCGKKKNGSKYTYVTASGVTTIYATEVEARAAQIRAGGGGTVRPA